MFKASCQWLTTFTKIYSMSLRRRSNKKHLSVEERKPKCQRWHARFRRRLKNGDPSKLHPKWGRWLPEDRISIDQVPCNLREGGGHILTLIQALRGFGWWDLRQMRGSDSVPYKSPHAARMEILRSREAASRRSASSSAAKVSDHKPARRTRGRLHLQYHVGLKTKVCIPPY